MQPTTQPVWWFKTKDQNDTHEQSNEVEFFTQQDAADRLVRETVQNAMDAALGDGPVRVRFGFTSLGPDDADHFLSGLKPHLYAQPKLEHAAVDRLRDGARCLLVEDFGTTGLTGPLVADTFTARDDEAGHRLHMFFMNFGITAKRGRSLGSFGIGKTVFQYSSKINTFFGLSTREAADATGLSTVLVGQARLHEHLDDDGNLKHHTGFFARFEGGLLHAIDASADIADFRRVFGLSRGADERGLSVAIIEPDRSLSVDALVRSAAEHFFMPILEGRLIVEVCDNAEGGESFILDAARFDETVEAIRWGDADGQRMACRTALARWILSVASDHVIELPKPEDAKSPKLSRDAFGTEKRKRLYAELLAGERLAIRAPVPVEPKGSDTVWSSVMVYLEYASGAGPCDDLYLRGGLTLIDHSGKLARRPGLRSILIATPPNDDEGDPRCSAYALLRASENVAHTRWSQRNVPRLTEDFTRGTKKVEYVLGLVRTLAEMLLTPEDEADVFTLAKLLPTPASSPVSTTNSADADDSAHDDGSGQDGPTLDIDDETNAGGPPDGIRSNPRAWRLRGFRSDDGCGVTLRPRRRGDRPPMALTLKAAYGAPGARNRFSKHRAEDFSFKTNEGVRVLTRNVEVEAVAHNELIVRPTSDDYELVLSGFSPYLALDCQVRATGPSSDSEMNGDVRSDETDRVTEATT